MHHGPLALGIVRSAQRATHRMLCHQSSRHTHQSGDVAEAGNVHADRRDARCLDCSLNVSHGHVANGSNRDEQSDVGADVFQLFGPFRCGVALDAEL